MLIWGTVGYWSKLDLIPRRPISRTLKNVFISPLLINIAYRFSFQNLHWLSGKNNRNLGQQKGLGEDDHPKWGGGWFRFQRTRFSEASSSGEQFPGCLRGTAFCCAFVTGTTSPFHPWHSLFSLRISGKSGHGYLHLGIINTHFPKADFFPAWRWMAENVPYFFTPSRRWQEESLCPER